MGTEIWPVSQHALNLESGLGALQYFNGDGTDHPALFKSVEEKPAAEGCRLYSGILDEHGRVSCVDLAVIGKTLYVLSSTPTETS